MPRALRRWLTNHVADAVVRAAPRLPPRALDGLAGVIRRLGPHTPVLARLVGENMQAAGVVGLAGGVRAAVNTYFARLAEHFAGALYAQHCAGRGLAAGALPARATELFELEASVAALRAAAGARGAILVGPHITNYLLFLARLRQEVPLTVYLRYSKDPRRRAAKEQWYAASGVEWICEPAGAGGPLGRMGRMAAALAAGRVLYITPDLPQKRGDGTAVRLAGREVWLPAGAALLAVRTGAPLFFLDVRALNPRVGQHAAATERRRLVARGPFEEAARTIGDAQAGAVSRARSGPRLRAGGGAPTGMGGLESGARAERRAAVAARMQWFADRFADFLRAEPAGWYLWGDKRWTRVWHGDRRYTRPAEA